MKQYQRKKTIITVKIGEVIAVKWQDSYGVDAGWKDISDYSAQLLIITSWGRVIFEDNKVIALAHNYADETANTCQQANGVMVIPKACIVEVATFSSCREPVLKQKRQRA